MNLTKLRSIRSSILFWMVLIFSQWGAMAQNYPVQTNIQLIPPYSVYLSDYYKGSTQKLLVNLMMKDLTRNDLSVKLKISIKGQGIEMSTRDDYVPKRPILLQPGAPELLYGDMLEEYMNPDHMTISGITKEKLLRNGRLPEGVYRFTVEVFEARRQVRVSNTSMAIGWLVLNEPPVITMPSNNQVVRASDPASILFNWLPRHLNSQNALSDIEYEFTLVELWPTNQPAEEAIRTKTPVLKTTFSGTSFVYDAQYPSLEPGRKYACRVRAVSRENKDMFKNEGYSPVISFVFGQVCKAPFGADVETAAGGQARLNLIPQSNHSSFTVLVRDLSNAGGSKWYAQSSDLPEFHLKQLKPGATYEYKVQGHCRSLESDYTPVKQFILPDKEQPYECGQNASVPEIDGSPALASLNAGEIINAGGFKVLVKEVSGGGGSFTGNGVVRIGFLGNIELRTVFQNIKVNQSHQLTGGEIRVVGSDIYALGGDIRDKSDEVFDSEVWDAIDEGIEVADELLDAVGELQSDMQDNNLNTQLQEARELIEKGRDELALGNQSGADMVQEGSAKVAALLDKVQNGEYEITPNGLFFRSSEQQHYGFDSRDEGLTEAEQKAYLPYYQSMQINDGSGSYYLMPWKSIAAHGSDQVDVNIQLGEGMSPDTVHFVNANGVEVQPIRRGDSYTLNLMGSSHDEVQQLTAFYNVKDTAGKQQQVLVGGLNVISYNTIQKELVLVPVNGNQTNVNIFQLQTLLNKAYSAANVKWTVSQHAGIQVEYNDEGSRALDDGKSGILSNFTQEMNRVIRGLKRSGDFNRNKNYIFLVNRAKNPAKLGFMPKKRRYGFVFTDPHQGQSDALCKTIAHEIAHGVFRLSHPFQDFPSLERGSTQNLMDYAQGTQLRKYQWDDIHHLRKVRNQQEEDAAMKMELIAQKEGYETDDNGFATFVSPSGLPITIKPTGKVEIITSTEEMEFPVVGKEGVYVTTGLDIGTLMGFEEDGFKYLAAFDSQQKFLGYWNSEKNYKYDNQTITFRESYPVNLINSRGEFYTIYNDYYLPENFVENTYTATGVIVPVGKNEFIDPEPENLTSKAYEKLIAKLSGKLGRKKYVELIGKYDLKDKDQLSIDDLNDRLKVFEKETGNKFFVDIVMISGKPTDEQLQTMAKDVVSHSGFAENQKVSYLLLPIWKISRISKELKRITRDYYGKSFHSAVPDYRTICDLHEFREPADGLLNVVKTTYKLMPKPLCQFNYYLSYRGDLIQAKPIQKTKVAGHDHIFELMIQFDDKLNPIERGLIADVLTETKNNWIAYELLDQNADRPAKIEYITTELSGLKESSLGLNLGKGYDIPTQFARWFAWHKFKIWTEAVQLKDEESPDNYHFLAGRNSFQHEATLRKIDAIGMALAPMDLDILADITGSVYCLLGADMDNAKIYAVSTVIPVASGGTLRMSKAAVKEIMKGSKVVGRINGQLKLWPNLNFRVFAKLHKALPSLADDVLMDLHDVIKNYPNVAKNITSEYAELLVKAGQGRTQVLKQLNSWSDETLAALSKDLKESPTFAKEFFVKVEKQPGVVESWKILDETSSFKALRTDINWLSRVNEWDEVGIGFAEFNGKLSLANKETGEVFADFVRNGSDEFFEIDVDNFLPYVAPTSGSIQWSESVTMTVRSASGENITGAIAKTTDGTFGFVEDVSSYGSAVVQNTITQRSLLRGQLVGIKATEEAHHLIPVELLKDNQVVQKAVEEGFDFNGALNGIPLEKYVNGSGRHARHDNYTKQIRKYLDKWVELPANKGKWTPADAQAELEDLVEHLRERINTTTEKINLIDLELE